MGHPPPARRGVCRLSHLPVPVWGRPGWWAGWTWCPFGRAPGPFRARLPSNRCWRNIRRRRARGCPQSPGKATCHQHLSLCRRERDRSDPKHPVSYRLPRSPARRRFCRAAPNGTRGSPFSCQNLPLLYCCAGKAAGRAQETLYTFASGLAREKAPRERGFFPNFAESTKNSVSVLQIPTKRIIISLIVESILHLPGG